MVTIKEFESLDIRVAEILSAEPVEGANKLYKIRISLGDSERQIVAGLRPDYAPEDLEGKKIIVIANLEPAKIRGIASDAMLLAAVDENVVSLLTVDRDVGAGSKIM